MVLRRIELVCGVLGGALGLVSLGVGLFAPLWILYCVPRGSGVGDLDCGSRFSGVQMAVANQELTSLWNAIVLFGVPSLGIVLFTVWHSRSRSLSALVFLWSCTVLLWWSMTVLVGLTPLGLFLIPVDMLALGASIVGTVAALQRVPAHM